MLALTSYYEYTSTRGSTAPRHKLFAEGRGMIEANEGMVKFSEFNVDKTR
jgi:hypothetical protein